MMSQVQQMSMNKYINIKLKMFVTSSNSQKKNLFKEILYKKYCDTIYQSTIIVQDIVSNKVMLSIFRLT